MYVYTRINIIIIIKLYLEYLIREVNLRGGWVRAGGARPGPLVLGLGFGPQVAFKRTKLVPATMNESGGSQQSIVSLF